MAGAGAKKKIFTEQQLKEVEQLAAQGLSQNQIAKFFGINEKTIIARKRDQKEFLEHLERGQAKGVAIITNSLFQTAKSGNVAAQQFYLKNRAGWRDKSEHEHTGKDGGPIRSEVIEWVLEPVSANPNK